MRLTLLTLVFLITAVCTSLTIVMIGPSPSTIKTKNSHSLPPSAKTEELPLFSAHHLEERTQHDLIAFCLEQLGEGNEILCSKGMLFYAKHFNDLATLKKAIEKNLIMRLETFKSDPFILSQIGSWLKSLEDEKERSQFILCLHRSLYKLWTSLRLPNIASKLTEVLLQEGEDEFLVLQTITQKAFYYACQTDEVRTLLFILPLMRKWQWEPENSRLISNNFSADAEFLYAQARLNEAYDKISIALFVNQDNFRARLLAQEIEERLSVLHYVSIACLEYPDSGRNNLNL